MSCYNLALYRLLTFQLATDKEAYLKKGSALDFASLLVARGELALARDLYFITQSDEYQEYSDLYSKLNESTNPLD